MKTLTSVFGEPLSTPRIFFVFGVLLIVLFSPNGKSATVVPSGPVTGVWTVPNSPYIITGNVVVAEMLTVAPGVTIKFEAGAYIEVFGVLTAIGTANERIVFTANSAAPSPGFWLGLKLFSNARTTLDHVEITYAATGLDLLVDDPNVIISNTDVSYCSLVGVEVSASQGRFILPDEVLLVANRIHDNEVGIRVDSAACAGASSNPLIDQNQIYDNRGSGIELVALAQGFGCTVGTVSVAPTITRNVVRNNATGISAHTRTSGCTGCSRREIRGTWQNNLVISNRGHGIDCSNAGSGLSAQFLNNTVIRNAGFGVFWAAGAVNNIVAENEVGIGGFRNAGQTAFNNCFANVAMNWSNYPPSFGLEVQTNRNGTPADADFNISINPEFVSWDDFHLNQTSRCVNAGTTLSERGIDFDGERRGTYVDIGFDEVFLPPTLSNAAMHNGKFTACVSGEVGMQLALERTSDLARWEQFATVTNLTGSLYFTNGDAVNPSRRFYRAKERP